MKSLTPVLHRAKEPLQLVERELPRPGPGEVLVHIEACGLGLTDWYVAMLDALPLVPLAIGCEAVGRIDGTGQRVGITPLATSCGTCEQCRAGMPHRCAAATWHGFSRNGALCERGNFAEQHLVPLPDDGDAAELAVLMGSGQAAFAALEAAGVPLAGGPVVAREDAGHPLGVFGLGGVGHLVVQLAGDHACGFDPDPARLALAKPHTSAGPLDAAIVCVPSPQAIQRAVGLLKPGGRLVLAASSPTGRLDVSLHAVTARGLQLIGTHLGGRRAVDSVLELYFAKKLKPVVTKKPLHEAPAQLYALRDGGFTGRLVFVPG